MELTVLYDARGNIRSVSLIPNEGLDGDGPMEFLPQDDERIASVPAAQLGLDFGGDADPAEVLAEHTQRISDKLRIKTTAEVVSIDCSH